MEFKITGHFIQRMHQRNITMADVKYALDHLVSTWPTPDQSTCLTGTTDGGRLLQVWVVGDFWPQSGIVTIKSTAWKDGE